MILFIIPGIKTPIELHMYVCHKDQSGRGSLFDGSNEHGSIPLVAVVLVELMWGDVVMSERRSGIRP